MPKNRNKAETITHYFRCNLCRVNNTTTNQAGNSGRRGHGCRKGDLIQQRTNREVGALRCEVVGTKTARQESDELKRKPFSQQHDHSRHSEAGHDTPVDKGPLVESSPALRTVDEFDIKHQKQGEQVSRYHDANRGSNESQLKFPHEQPVDENVDGRNDEDDVRDFSKQPLCLENSLSCLERDVRRDGKDHNLQVGAGKAGSFCVDDARQDALGKQPQYRHGYGSTTQEPKASLALQADEVLAAITVRLCAQGIETGREADKGRKAGHSCRHIRHYMRS